MIKDAVIHNGLLRIATGTFVCMVGIPDGGPVAAIDFGGLRVVRDPLGATHL